MYAQSINRMRSDRSILFIFVLFKLRIHLFLAGFCPVWDTLLEFTISNPDMAVMRFKVKDQDNTSYNTLIGHYNIPVNCLQQGTIN